MNEQEEIRQLQEELLQLHRQLQQQQQQISWLHGRLMKLSGKEETPVRQARSSFSLENFIGLRLIHLVGIVVLVIGLSIGVKYAIDRNLISEVARVAMAYAAGAALYLLSLRLKEKYNLFSAILLSGGMASLYFTTYGAYVYYALMPFAMAFGIMVLLTAFTVMQALKYNRQEIAIMGLVGAYGIPFLISSNNENAALLFLYISVINIGVVYLCIKKPWVLLGRVAQATTWILFLSWAALRFDAGSVGTGTFFLVLFFLTFLVDVLGVKWFRKERLSHDAIIQLLLNHLAFYAGALMVLRFSGGEADSWVTLGMSLLLAVEAALFLKTWRTAGAHVGLGSLAFLLLAAFIAIQWKGVTVTMLWLLLSVCTFVAGVQFRSARVRILSIVLMGTTLLKLLLLDSLTFTTIQKVISYLLLGVLLLVVSFLYQKYRKQIFSDEA